MRVPRLIVLVSGIVAVLALGTVAALALTSGDPKQVRYGSTKPEFAPRPGSVRVEARAADPGGDAPWVVRVWRTRDNGQACVQLGREVDGVIGEVGLDGRFRPLEFGERSRCSSRVFDSGAPIVQVATFLDDPLDPDTTPLRTVAWGLAGPRSTGVTITSPSGMRAMPVTPRRAWVDVHTGDTKTYELVTRVRYRSGTTQVIDYGRARRPSRHPVADSVRVGARSSSPGGGPDYGVLSWRTANGSTCFTDGRMLGDNRLGSWSEDGTFFDYPIGEGASCLLQGSPSRNQPFAFGFSSGVGTPGILSGVAHPEVERIVVEGVGRRRELTPGPRGEVFALFAAKASGRLRQQAVFEDGTVKELPALTVRDWRRYTRRTEPALKRIRPHVVPVSPDGRIEILVSCEANRRGRKCMGALHLHTAKAYRRGEGLSRHLFVASRLVRIAGGTQDRPLRVRLNRYGRALLRRERRVTVVATHSRLPRPVAHRLVLVQRRATAPSPQNPGTRIVVSPAQTTQRERVTIRFRPPFLSTGAQSTYRVRLFGPANDCRTRGLLAESQFSWHPRNNARHQRNGFRTGWRPTRVRSKSGERQPPDLQPRRWCPGRFRGDVTFIDRSGRRGTVVRHVGEFSFRVR